jgi:large subunit ribosomal protein L21
VGRSYVSSPVRQHERRTIGPASASFRKSSQGVDPAMYAIVKTGGKQYKVAVGDVVEIEKLDAALGAEVALPAILLVDGEAVTHDAAKLAKVAVTAEVLAQTKGPKIRIHKFKNKTGYHKRMGHRQKLTQVKVTAIDAK